MAETGQDKRMPGEPLGIDHNQVQDTGKPQEEASVRPSSLLYLGISLSLAFGSKPCCIKCEGTAELGADFEHKARCIVS